MSCDIVDKPASQFVLFWGAGFALPRALERLILFPETLLARNPAACARSIRVAIQENDGAYAEWSRGFLILRQH